MDYGIFNVRTNINACDCTRGCTDTVRETALRVDSGRKIPCCTRESNLCQQRAGPMLYQLNNIPIPHFLVFSRNVSPVSTLRSNYCNCRFWTPWQRSNSWFWFRQLWHPANCLLVIRLSQTTGIPTVLWKRAHFAHNLIVQSGPHWFKSIYNTVQWRKERKLVLLRAMPETVKHKQVAG